MGYMKEFTVVVGYSKLLNHTNETRGPSEGHSPVIWYSKVCIYKFPFLRHVRENGPGWETLWELFHSSHSGSHKLVWGQSELLPMLGCHIGSNGGTHKQPHHLVRKQLTNDPSRVPNFLLQSPIRLIRFSFLPSHILPSISPPSFHQSLFPS